MQSCWSALRGFLSLFALFLSLGASAAIAGEVTLGELVEKLGHKNPGIRAQAADALGDRKAKEALEPLIKRLALDRDVLVRRACARALGKIKERKALKPLLFAITHQEDSGVIKEAVEAARAIDRKSAVKHLVAALSKPKSKHAERLNVVQALCLMPEKTSLNALLKASLDDPFMIIRKAAVGGAKNAPDRRKVLGYYLGQLKGGNKKKKRRSAFALGQIGDQDARAHLLQVGLAPNSRMEFHALQALAKIPHVKSIPMLLKAWHDNRKHPELQMTAIHALAEIHSVKTVPALKWAIEHEDWFIRYLGAVGLGRLAEDAGVFDYLMKGLQETSGEKAYDFVIAMAIAARTETTGVLAETVKASNLKVALAAVDALSRIDTEASRGALTDLLEDDRAEIRGLAARRLGIMKHAPACEKLIELLADKSFPVQMDAAQALGRLKQSKAVPFLIALGVKTHDMLRPGLRAVVAQALGDTNSTLGDSPAFHESLKYLISLLKDKDLLVRAAAAWALEGAVCKTSVQGLIDAWETEKHAYAAHTFFQALRSLTKEHLPEDQPSWKAWWKEAKEKFGRKATPLEVSIPAFQVYLKELRSKGLDLVFVLDVTGSMGAELEEAQRRTGDIVRILRRVIPSLRVGFVAFRDDVASDEKLSLTFDYEEVSIRLNKLEASGGGDINEAVCLGFESALREQGWRKEARKVIVLVGDAPPHEPKKAALIAFLANREMGVEFSSIETHVTDVVHLPSFVEVAALGGGQVVRLDETRDLLRHLVISALGPEWRAEAERVIEALMD
ncbi:MAG: HEAT repeat domain-containing protein [Planctomycetota bacterium]